MTTNEWNFFDDIGLEETEYVEPKKSSKNSKRKWREIENYKEQRQLSKDLESYTNYIL